MIVQSNRWPYKSFVRERGARPRSLGHRDSDARYPNEINDTRYRGTYVQGSAVEARGCVMVCSVHGVVCVRARVMATVATVPDES